MRVLLYFNYISIIITLTSCSFKCGRMKAWFQRAFCKADKKKLENSTETNEFITSDTLFVFLLCLKIRSAFSNLPAHYVSKRALNEK